MTGTHSIRALMTGLIDYAGLFPPAALGMQDAVTRYASYRRGPHAWMLGRFIVPARRLREFEEASRLLLPSGEGAVPWRLSALASDDVAADSASIDAFNARHVGGACIDAFEVKAESAADVHRVAAAGLPAMRVWFEVAPGPALGSLLDAIGDVGQGAKIRTGGTTAEAIPDARAVAHFLFACARAGVMCKATAGLHHPIHASHRLTYADDSPTAMMHGFVNVFLAAALARDLVLHGYPDPEIVETLVALLAESAVHHFVWHDDHVMWRRHRFDVPAIESTREQFARSFGSCSFEEPIEDLRQLGWL